MLVKVSSLSGLLTPYGDDMTVFQRYLLNKAFWFFVAFFIALILNFLLPRLVPGNPVDAIVGTMGAGGGITGEALQKVYAAYIEEFGLDKSLVEQFFTYVSRLAQGDLGISFARSPARVQNLIVQALPWTQAADVLEVLGDVTDAHTEAAYELGGTLAALLID